jgi:serine protease Do
MKKLLTAFIITTVCLTVSYSVSYGPELIAQSETEILPKLKDGQPLPHDLFIKLAKAVNPAIVNINTSYLPKRPSINGRAPHPRDPLFELFEQFMGPMQNQGQPAQSLGTGFIIREDGLIITNNHVIDKADEIKVTLDEGSKESFDAEVIGKDARTDIALIKIKTKKKLPVLKFGSSEGLQVGEWVAAFGNPYGHGHSVTKGIISAIGREIDELNMLPFIQTDASINPGNSGGPLVNTQGLVVGVNTAIDARAQGIGFAIPIDHVKEIIPQLEKNGEVKRGFLGVGLQDLDPNWSERLGLKDTKGALITQVFPNTPAAKAGIAPYDVVTKFNGKSIENSRDLSKSVARTKIGEKITLEVLSEGKKKTLSLTVGESSESSLAEMEEQPPTLPRGKKAPHGLGFEMVEYDQRIAQSLGIGIISSKNPIVVGVERGSLASRAGLAPGDVILDVNRKATNRVSDVTQALKKSGNIMRVFKQGRVVLIGM